MSKLHAAAAPNVSFDLDDREALVREVALALHRAGAPAHRLEDTVDALAAQVGLEARLFSTPTAIYASFGPVEDARTVLLRARLGGLDLGRLADVDAIARDVLDGTLDASAAVQTLREREQRPPTHGQAVVLPAFAVTGVIAAVLFGGGVGEALASALVSVFVGAAMPLFERNARLTAVADLALAALAGLLAGLVHRLLFPADPGIVTIASIIALVPGLTLTTAIMELATHHVVSGTARLAGAITTFAKLGLGALGATLLLSPWEGPAVVPSAFPTWLPWALLPLAALTFTILLQARLRDLPAIAAASITGFVVVQLAHGHLPAPFDAALGAAAVAFVSNGIARWRDSPAAVNLVPGLFLLLPGSAGFRGLSTLLDADLVGGMDQAVGALLTAAALAAGVLVAQLVLSPRRAL